MSGNATSPPSLPIDTTNPIPGADSLPTENAADPYKAPGITHDTPETEAVADSTESLSYPTGHVPVETNAPTSPSPPAGARAEAPLTRKAHDPDKVTKTSETAEGSGAHQPDPSTSTTPERESTIDDILKAAKRFRILLSGVGKSSLINCVFGIEAAHVEDQKPGKANIRQELVSPENQYFVLHDSQGFEPGDLSNFETVRNFVQERSREELPLSEKIHGLWYESFARRHQRQEAGRVFETGDEKLLQFAHEKKVPIVVVFTKYDKLVRTKEGDLLDEHPDMDHTRMHDRGVEEARKTFDECLKSFQDTVGRLGIPMPRYATVSVRPGHAGDVLSLVQVTRDTVKDRVEGDAWVLWAIAQRASLPVKFNACVTKGISYDSISDYRRTLMDSQRAAPESGPILLRDCIGEVHKDIMTCWNFKGEVLNSPEFRQLMLCLVQDVHTDPNVSTLPNVDIISQFVELVTAVPAPIAPPGTILGLSYMFVKWLSTTSLESIPSVQRFLIAYAVGLVGVLRNLFEVTVGFDLALKPDSVLTPTWKELREAFEFYENVSRQRIHHSIHSNIMQGRRMTGEDMSEMFRKLLLPLLDYPALFTS
ncbi:hypothetical protein EDB87DRAFT_1580388 [Lactarius vividus]|nr:hypothetical protein EDB87DRAFT_1580388 [Lactarius vividus]